MFELQRTTPTNAAVVRQRMPDGLVRQKSGSSASRKVVMRKRALENMNKDSIALEGVGEEFMSAVEIAMRLNQPWRIVLHALNRLHEQGKVERTRQEYKGEHRSKESHYVFRKTGMAHGLFPAWLLPQLPKYGAVIGVRKVTK